MLDLKVAKMVECKKERIKLKSPFVDLFCFSALLTAVFGVSIADAAQAPNPRGAAVVVSHGGTGAVVRGGTENAGVVSRATNSRVATNDSRGASSTAKAGAARTTSARLGATSARGASNATKAGVARTATVRAGGSGVRSEAGASSASANRASRSRAVALFTDVSKIGGGYATCREAYATCMDQFCATANETYRRCFCSDKFTEIRNTEAALDEARNLLAQFEDNNLNAVDKTADEVNAMYSATVGEAAIKQDTSAAQQTLDRISDLLSGKKTTSVNNSTTSLGILSLDFSTDMDDIWSGSTTSLFDTNSGVDLNALESKALYNAASKQCLQLMEDQCESDAVLNMSTSAYGIMITQDCNIYEKSLNAKREAVQQTVRQAEKILREARLEEYREHNSDDVNECVAKVRNAMLTDVACGANFERCLDYSGAYVNQSTGEAIYSPRLFELEDIIVLGGASAGFDVLGQNPQFNKFLDDKKMFANTALDSCRGIADIVWTEFKRSALIEIAQAQDELIEETKMSCVSTMKECYDTQTSSLKGVDDTTAQMTGALSVYAAKAMCQEKVTACAALYGGNSACRFDGNGHLTSNAQTCGLAALLALVDTVDDVRVAEGCAASVDKYVQELCTPTTGDMGFPWDCRGLNMWASSGNTNSIESMVVNFAIQNCGDPTASNVTFASLPSQTRTQVERSLRDIEEQLDYQLQQTCEGLDGIWLRENDENITPLTAFYSRVFGGNVDAVTTAFGNCAENTVRTMCEAQNVGIDTPVATYNALTDECVLADTWYQSQCTMIGGYYDLGACYVGRP